MPQPVPTEALVKALIRAAERQVMLGNLDALSKSLTWQSRARNAGEAALKKVSISTSTKDVSNHLVDMVFTVLAIIEVASPPGIDWAIGVLFAAAKQEVEAYMQKAKLNEIDGHLAPGGSNQKSTYQSLEDVKTAASQAVDELQKFDKLLSEFRKVPAVQLKSPDDIQSSAAKIYRARSEYFKVMQSVQTLEIGAAAMRVMLENMKKYLEKYLENHRAASKTLVEKLADENLKKGKAQSISAPFNVTSSRIPRPNDIQLKPPVYNKPLPPSPSADEHTAEERLAEWIAYYFASGKAGA